jgi:protein TonB
MTSKTTHSLVAGSTIVLLFSISIAFMLLVSCSNMKKTTTSQPVAEQSKVSVKPVSKPDVILTAADGPALEKVEQNPEYVGGYITMMKFLRDNMRYPTEAQEARISGTVFVQFVVKSNGQVANVRRVKGIGGGCDEEAVRVVKKMPNWIPGMDKGIAVNTLFMIPISFKLTVDNFPVNNGNR